MKISHIESLSQAMPLTRPYSIAFRDVTDVRMQFLEVHSDTGLVGRGCASPEAYVTGETQIACEAALEAEQLDWLLGREPVELNTLCRTLAMKMPDTPAARAAVDMALHDLLAQVLGVPLVDLLGRAHHSLPTSITIGIKSVEETLDEAREYLQRGFKILKVKLGNSLDEDLERLSRLREVLGAQITIRVDPNQGYNADQLQTFISRSRHLGVEFLEQPMAANAIDAMRTLPEAIRDRLAADESLLDESDALNLIQAPRACGIFNIKLMKCGGIRPASRIATLADIAGIELMWGCMDESIISISAALHIALASPATRYLDLDGSLDLASDRVSGGFALDEGMLSTLQAPGLGLQPL